MSRRHRKADEPLSNPPVSKKLRTNSNQPHDLNAALFANGAPRKLNAHLSNASHGNSNAHRIDDTKAIISKSLGHGVIPTPHVDKPPVIDISSDSSSNDDSDGDSGDEEEIEETLVNRVNGNSHNNDDLSPTSFKADNNKENKHDSTAQDMDEDQEPSFGDLLATATSGPIVVESALQPTGATTSTSTTSALAPHLHQSNHTHSLITPSSTTLSTVLSQALHTNDSSLLESCLQLNDLAAVRGTITRLPSPLAEALLSALAARLHARPGRANNLIVWLQWTLVAHGGYLAGRRGLVARLGALQRVVRERANGLAPLLALKGKLDMLSAQMELRRLAGYGDEEDSEEGVVVYVEDEEDTKGEANEGATTNDDEDDDDEDGLLGLDDDAIVNDLEDEEDDSDEDSSSDDDSETDSDASTQGFSDQGVEEDVSSPSEEEDEDASPAPKSKLRKGR
jgi:U3 small nucleolar RNA-associated protein 5